jgi:hypothetical protein
MDLFEGAGTMVTEATRRDPCTGALRLNKQPLTLRHCRPMVGVYRVIHGPATGAAGK